MNYTINPLPLNEAIPIISNELPKECLRSKGYSLSCIYEYICPQFPKYFINVGITLIITYFVFTWVVWWFFTHGYKKLSYREDLLIWRFLGNFHYIETRAFWEIWLRTRMTNAFLIFTIVLVFLALSSRFI